MNLILKLNRKVTVIVLACCLMSLGSTVNAEDESPGKENQNVEVVKDGDLYTLKANDAVLSDILAELGKQSAIKLDIDPQLLNERHSLNMEGVTYEDIVKELAGSHALIYEKSTDGEYRLISARLTGRQDYIAPELGELSKKDSRNVSDKVKQIKKIIGKIDGIYGFAGELNYEQAKMLSEERLAKVQELVEQLKALGPGGARAMLEAYGEGTSTRESLAMIQALGYIDDPDAANVLGKMFADEKKYSLQREIVGSLGHRSGEEVNAILQGILDSQQDIRLRAATTQAMAGRAESLNALQSLVNSPVESPDVQSEAIRSIGLIANESAMVVLTGVAANSAYKLPLRKTAIQELGRSFGPASMPSLTMLMESQDEAIRYTVVKSLAKVESPEAMDVLQAVAKNDVSAAIRANAEAILATKGTAAPASAN